MGKVADEAIRARRRRRTDNLARIAATQAAALGQTQVGERQCLVAVSEVRRALRIQRLADDAIAAADQRAAAAAEVLTEAGLAQTEIAARCGVPLWTIRRLLALRVAANPEAASSGDLH